jgi:ABC-type polysaccharide/polyol phosphate export permease
MIREKTVQPTNSVKKNRILDVVSALAAYELWLYLAWQDIRLRYRRSKIGPLWITLSMAIFCLALGAVYSKLFKTNMVDYLPFLSIGFVVWGFISGMLGEFPNLYVENSSYLKNTHINPITILFRAVARNVLIFGHNVLIIIGIYIYFKIQPGMVALLAIPGLLLVTLNLVAIGIPLSIVGARFRDIAPINQSLIQILFFISPITWMPHLLATDSWALKANPIGYYLDLIRSPLLGIAPAPSSWFVSIVTLAISSVVAIWVYQLKSSRIPYWV